MNERVGRFEESVEIIRKCWTGEPFSHHGKHFHLDDVQVLPKPYTQPAPPLWIGASSKAAVVRAGRLADTTSQAPALIWSLPASSWTPTRKPRPQPDGRPTLF